MYIVYIVYTQQRLVSTLTIKTSGGPGVEALERIIWRSFEPGRFSLEPGRIFLEPGRISFEPSRISFESGRMRRLLPFTAILSFLATCHGKKVNMHFFGIPCIITINYYGIKAKLISNV